MQINYLDTLQALDFIPFFFFIQLKEHGLFSTHRKALGKKGQKENQFWGERLAKTKAME